jgi:hypothetical protein
MRKFILLCSFILAGHSAIAGVQSVKECTYKALEPILVSNIKNYIIASLNRPGIEVSARDIQIKDEGLKSKPRGDFQAYSVRFVTEKGTEMMLYTFPFSEERYLFFDRIATHDVYDSEGNYLGKSCSVISYGAQKEYHGVLITNVKTGQIINSDMSAVFSAYAMIDN